MAKSNMTESDKATLRNRIAAWLAEHPDSTTIEIAHGIDADEWDVQHAVLFMVNDGIATQVGKRETAENGLRPIYRMTTEVQYGNH